MDFVVSSTMIVMSATILMCVAVAFTYVEVLQYVSFSGARAYFAGDVTPAAQKLNAQNKLAALLGSLPVLKEKDNAWITVTAGTGKVDNFKGSYGSSAMERPFHSGVEINFELAILKFKIPFVGGAIDYNGEEVPSPTVASLLGREPSFEECRQLLSRALSVLVQKNGSYRA